MSQTAQLELTETDRAAAATNKRRWLGLGVIAVSQLLIVLDATIVNVALPAVSADLQVADADRQWIVTIYALAFGGLLLLGGRIADYLGLRRALLVGMAGFAVASAIGGVAGNLGVLLLARAGQGAFSAVMAPAALALLATTFTDPRERAKAFSVFGAVAGGGSALGLIFGGILTEYLNWRWTMYVNIPVAIFAFIGAKMLLPDTKSEHPGRLDLVGTVLGTAGLLTLVYSFSEAERSGWTQASTLTWLGSGLSLLVAFVVSQRIVANPLLPLRLFSSRTRSGAMIAVGLASVGMFGAFFFLTFYLQGVLGFSPVKTGVAFLPVTGGVLVSSAIISGVMDRMRPRAIIGAGLFGAAAGLLLLVRMTPESSYSAEVLPALILIGLSLGGVFVPSFNAGTVGVAPADAGVASAAINTAQQVGGALGVALLSSVAANRTAEYLQGREITPDVLVAGQVEGFARAALVAGLILLVAGVVTTVMINVRRLEAAHPGDPTALAAVPAGAGGTDAPTVNDVIGRKRVPPPASPGGPNGRHPDAQVPARPVSAPVAEPGSAAPPAPAVPPVPAAPPVQAFRPGPPVPAARPQGDGKAGTALPARGHIGVRVRHRDGVMLPGALVTLLDEAGRPLGTQRANADGEVDFAPAEGSIFVVVVSHPGFLPKATTVPLPATSAQSLGIEVALAPAARLAGRVLTARTRTPVRDALVTLTDANGLVIAATSTDAQGTYVLVDLTVESGTLTVTGPALIPNAVAVTIPAGSNARADVDVRSTGSVDGIARTASGAPIADARVSLLDASGNAVAVTHTDARGLYSFAEVEEGAYTLVAVGYPQVTAELSLSAGQSLSGEVTLAHAHVPAPPAARAF
ncbi:MAG: MFS transporter [Sporichthyaceae bacterium]